jgi:hypothetical protein
MLNSWRVLRTFVTVFGTLTLGSVAAAQTPSLVWTIPGTVNAGGLNNTRFVSDLAVTNPGSAQAQATISFVPANGTTPRQVTLGAGETVVYRNVLDSLWGAQGAGATQVASDLPLLIRARTYNTAASGTYGVALPVFADDRLLAPGDSAHSLWISQSADGTSGYRTNVAVVFPDAGGGAATVTIYDADGAAIGSQDFSLDAPGFQQFGVGGFAGAVSVARAQVRVSRGRAAGYSVVVDNITGDSSLFTFENLPAGWQDVLVNGVARANGRNNTFFRTDGRFYNPSTRDAVVTVSFHASGDSNRAPATRDVTIPAGRILDVTDVLDTLLGIPVGLAGALRFRSISPVGILCRTSNVDPAGIKPGTYGAQQKPTPLLSFLMSADAGAVVTGIRQGAAFRTNIGFAAGGDGAAYSLTLKSTSGATVTTSTGSLGAFGWTQPNFQDLFPGTTIPDDATLLVRVTAGSVDVFDSSIDNASGDPVVTPIMPLPVDIPPSATIGSQGGSIRSTDGRFTLTVPAGALSTPAAFSVVPIANAAPDGVGAAYEVTPDPIGLSGSGVVLTYLPDDLEGSGASALAVVALDGGTWRDVQRGAIDTVRRSVTVPLAFSAAGTAARSPAERRSLGAGSRAISLFKKLSLTPKRETLLTSQSTIFQVRGPASAIAAIFASRWSANDGTLTPNGTLASYKAPDKAPSGKDNPVEIEFQFGIDEGNDISDNYHLTSRVRILPRSWTFDATASLGWSCGRIKLCFEALSYKDTDSVDFELDETLAVSQPSGGLPSELANDLTKCSNFDKNGDEGVVCPGPIAPNKMIPMSIDAFSGKFDKALDRFVLTATLTNAFYNGGFYQNCTRDGVPLSLEPSGGMIWLLSPSNGGFNQTTTKTMRVPPSSEFWLEIPMYSFTDIYTVKGDLSVRK